MRITLDIDDCYSKRNLWVFAGMEPVARKRFGGPWEIKTEQCERCGLCCLHIREDHPLGTEFGCKHLIESGVERMCGLTIFRPHGCAIADGHQLGIETCSVKWETKE